MTLRLLAAAVAVAHFAGGVAESAAFVGGRPFDASVQAIGAADVVFVRARGAANVNVRRGATVRRGTTVVVRRPVRVWAPRPWYGAVVAGVTLGTVIAVSAAAMAPPPPASNLCWFWTDPAMTRGYWDYCAPPR